MLRISKLADYGTVVMVYLARHFPAQSNARLIALHTHLNVPTVSKLLKRLTSAGLLVSERGVSGGYRLSRDAKDISVAEIIDAVDEKISLTECGIHGNACALEQYCSVQGNWRFISNAIEHALDSVSLAALAKPSLAKTELNRIKALASGVQHG